MNKRRWVVLAGSVVVAIVAGIGIKSIFDARASKERQTLYTAALKDYSDALVTGTSRREVEAYLRQRHHPYRQMCCVANHRSAYADLVKVGQEKAPWFCNQSNIYVAFEFDAIEPHGPTADARDSDKLLGTKLFPWLEQCL
jgi:hypothetical protein